MSEVPNHKDLMTDDRMTLTDDNRTGKHVSSGNKPYILAIPDDTANTDVRISHLRREPKHIHHREALLPVLIK